MNLKLIKPVFNRYTGKPNGTELISTNKVLCDYSGEVIDLDELDGAPMYKLMPHYNNDCEMVWEEDKVKRTFRVEYNLDYGCVFKDPFVFAVDPSYRYDNSLLLVQEWLEQRTEAGGPYSEAGTIEEVMRISRVNLILKFLKEKTYTPEELGLELYS